MVRSSIAEMEARLDARLFIKINRSNLLNVQYVTKVETDKVFVNETEFSVAKPQRDALLKLMDCLA